MDNEKKSKIIAYIRNQITLSGNALLEKTLNDNGEKLAYRDIYHSLNGYMRDFERGVHEPRWIAVSGLRGVGKTTVLAQLYTDLKTEKFRKLYLSLDQTTSLGFSLQEIISSYEEFLGESFETLKSPLFLFLDEVQYQENWAVISKTIYDRAKNVFIIETGSSAIALQTNADIHRRMILQKIYPFSFCEYIHAKFQHTVSKELSTRIKVALFYSENADEVYTKLQKETENVMTYFDGIEKFDIDKYLKYGTLPFVLFTSNESIIYQQINGVMGAVIDKDVTKLETFDKTTISKLPQLLYALSGADIVSNLKLSQVVGLDPRTVTQVLDAFEKTGIVFRVMPYGHHYSQVKKPSKYLFTSSSYRAMYYNLIGSIEQFENYKGKLLEDIIGMYLNRLFADNLGTISLTYDNAQSGADFILEIKAQHRKIVLEVSTGKKGQKGIEQTVSTLKKVEGAYGLIISQNHLAIDRVNNCVFVPIEYFFSM